MMTSPVRLLGTGRKAAVLATQFTIGILCLTGASIAATWLLSGAAEPGLRKATFATAEEWPEIKNGVPELRSITSSTHSAGLPRSASLASDPPPDLVQKAPELSRESAKEAAPVVSGVAEPSTASETQMPRFDADASQPSVVSQKAVSHEPRALAERPFSAEQPVAPSAAEVATPPPVATSAVAPARTRPRATPPAASKGTVVNKRAGPDAQRSGAVVQPGSTAKARPTSGSAQPRMKTARSQRTRTAAAPSQATPAVASPTEEAPGATEEPPIRLLGIPLPTGRKLKECLLELRC